MKNLEALIDRGNVIRTLYKEDAECGCYLGNGRFGGVFSPLGLNMSPEMKKKYPGVGHSQFNHMHHWGRFSFFSEAMKSETTADYILPLFQLYWEKEPETVQEYMQCQKFYDGILSTSYKVDGKIRVQVRNWFDFENKNLAGIKIELSEGSLPIRLSAITRFVPYEFLYKKMTGQKAVYEQLDEDNWKICVCCEDTENKKCTEIHVYSTAPVELCGDGLRISVQKGSNQIYISVGSPIDKEDTEDSLIRTQKCWNQIWEKSGWLDFPDDEAQKTWIRSMAYLISSYDDDCGMIQPTNGLTGNMFPFHFVQDMEYMAPALMMMGHGHIVKRWIERFAGQVGEMRKYAKRLWKEAEGIYPPWELPYGPIEGYHEPSVPVIYCYEPHNVGYLCRMAKEAAEFIGDDEWRRKYVFPLVQECAAFYRAFFEKKEDGMWHFRCYPCIGQDEAGGRNKEDYLCSLYSAKYTFQAAVGYGLDDSGKYAEILKDGLAFESLRADRGTLHTAQDAADDFGRQKHPVQLDGLTYFPTESGPLEYETRAYGLRHEITDRAKEPFYFGWTLGQFLLAGSNQKDSEGWKSDWKRMRESDYTDSEWIQIYETSTEAEKSFYVTNQGMILQSLIRNYVNDYWGTIEIGGCPVFEGRVSFGRIRTRLGAEVSGWEENGNWSAEICALQNGVCRINDRTVGLKKGERKRFVSGEGEK